MSKPKVKHVKETRRRDPWKELREKVGVTVKETAKR